MKPRRVLSPADRNIPAALAEPVKKDPPGCGMILLLLFGLFLLIALPGYIITLANPSPAAPRQSALERRVAEDLHREEAEKQRAVEETLERIRQKQ